MSAFRQRLFRQNSLNQDSPKFFLAKVSSFTVDVLLLCQQQFNLIIFKEIFHQYQVSHFILSQQ